MFTSFSKIKIRLGLALMCAVSVFIFPWWITLVLAFVLCVRYRAWEVVPIAIAFDLMWLPELSFSIHGLPLATITAFALLIVLEPLRRELLTGSALP